MNQQDYIDRGDLNSIEHILRNLIMIDPEASSVINSKEFTQIEIILRTWKQELFELMLRRMKEEEINFEALKSMPSKKSNSSRRPDDNLKQET